MECSRRLFLKKCGCQPYFYPIRGKDMKVCGIHDVDCSFDASKMAQMLAFPSSSVQIELNELGLLCSCPSSCNEVIYSIETSSAPFPSEMAYQSSETIQQTVAKGKGKVDLRFLQKSLLTPYSNAATLFRPNHKSREFVLIQTQQGGTTPMKVPTDNMYNGTPITDEVTLTNQFGTIGVILTGLILSRDGHDFTFNIS
eukprot:TCALIF_01571-PA protein Name:"Protein of unknown function" AED:0.43 eAED:0.43 QI:0/0.5/0.4/0.6/1/1/5/0/197